MQSLSATFPPKPENESFLEERRSAPSNFVSLTQNEAPPFKNPGPNIKPELLVWTLMSENQTKEVIEIAHLGNNELRKTLECILVNKNFVTKSDISEKLFLSSLLTETYRYGVMLRLNTKKISTLLTIYANCHKFFKSNYWLPPSSLWAYFKDLMFRHSIDDSPDGQEIFEPEEACDIMTHFHAVYLCNLPLIHIRTFQAHRLKFSWSFQA